MATKKCPRCGKQIAQAAIKCKYCREWLNLEEKKEMTPCPFCREEIEKGSEKCIHCDEIISNYEGVKGTVNSLPEKFDAQLWINYSLFQKLFSFKGRVRRRDYLVVQLSTLVISLLSFLGIVFISEEAAFISEEEMMIFTVISLIAIIAACCWISIMFDIKRFHDIGSSGWWVVSMLIPLIGYTVTIWLFFIKGEQGANRFGPDPRVWKYY